MSFKLNTWAKSNLPKKALHSKHLKFPPRNPQEMGDLCVWGIWQPPFLRPIPTSPILNRGTIAGWSLRDPARSRGGNEAPNEIFMHRCFLSALEGQRCFSFLDVVVDCFVGNWNHFLGGMVFLRSKKIFLHSETSMKYWNKWCSYKCVAAEVKSHLSVQQKQYLYIPGKCSVDRFQKLFLGNQPSIFRNSLPKGSLLKFDQKKWFINSTNLQSCPPKSVQQKIPHSKPKTQQSNWVNFSNLTTKNSDMRFLPMNLAPLQSAVKDPVVMASHHVTSQHQRREITAK